MMSLILVHCDLTNFCYNPWSSLHCIINLSLNYPFKPAFNLDLSVVTFKSCSQQQNLYKTHTHTLSGFSVNPCCVQCTKQQVGCHCFLRSCLRYFSRRPDVLNLLFFCYRPPARGRYFPVSSSLWRCTQKSWQRVYAFFHSCNSRLF